jgi:hypothetical protein
VVTIKDANVLTKSFQNQPEVPGGYTGNSDAYLDGQLVSDFFGQDPVVRVDQVKGSGGDLPVVRPQQGLIRFDNLFGSAMNQIPKGSTIFSAFMTLNVQNIASGAEINFFRMLQDWEQVAATWLDPQGSVVGSISNGVTPDDVEATTKPDATVPEPGRAGSVDIQLNVDTIQAWANESEPNYGWSIISDSGSLWAFNSSESFLPGTARPKLTILYTEPVLTEDLGVFSLSRDTVTVTENGAARFTVNRIGGSTGVATMNWAISATGSNTGSAADILGATSGSVSFSAGELFDTFTVNINNDALIERNETLTMTLSGAGLTFGRDLSKLVIRDNDFNPFGTDLLLNEIWVNSPGFDPPYEFVELKGTPGIALGSLYYVAIEGLVGDREGAAEKVVNIGEFLNGSAAADGKGYSVLTPQASGFGFRIPAAATQIDRLGPTTVENVATDNGTTTFMLLYSPLTNLTETEFDYDWNNDGALDLPAGVEIVDSLGFRIIGPQDQTYGPASNQLASPLMDPEIDAVSRSRTNTERNKGSAWFGGNLRSAGDDYLLYEPTIMGNPASFGLPVTGTALAPGEPNTGTSVQSPLVSLLSVVSNPNGTVTANFSGNVAQVVVGDGSATASTGAGISVTDVNGVVLPTINARPMVTGFGTNALTLTFSGSGVVNGQLPPGTYRLNFIGNGIIANSRATDVANNGTQINGIRTEALVVTSQIDGDFDNDGDYDCNDINALTNAVATGGSVAMFDLNGDSMLSLADVDEWRAEAGAVNLGTGQVYPKGDANLSGMTDNSDFLVWDANKFTFNTQWCSANFNADLVIDGADFSIWNENKTPPLDLTSHDLVVPLVDYRKATPPVKKIVSPGLSIPVAMEWDAQRGASAVGFALQQPRVAQPTAIDRVFAAIGNAATPGQSRRIRALSARVLAELTGDVPDGLA